MNKRGVVVVAIAVLAAVVVFLLPGDEKKIKANLVSLAEYGSTPSGEAMLDSLQKTAQAVKLCANPFRVAFESRQIDREFIDKELSDRVMMVKKSSAGTTFSFEDIRVTLLGEDRAEVVATLRVESVSENNRFTDAYETVLEAEQQGGDWLFSSLTIVEFLKK